MKTKTARSLISTKAAAWLIAWLVFTLVSGILALWLVRSLPTLVSQTTLAPTGPTTVKRINADVIELSWNGAPKDGYVLSGVLDMKVGDTIIIYWLGGCLQSRPLRECNQPWGFFDPAPENQQLFRHPRGQFALHIVQGDGSRVIWERGASEMVLEVSALPVKFDFNGLANPGIYYGAGVRLPIDGYTPPVGQLLFRIVNRVNRQ